MDIVPYIRRYRPRLWFLLQFLKYRHVKGEREIRVLHLFVPRGRLALDVGASFGFYSRALAGLAPKVIAFEPNPELAAFARQVLPRNVDVISVALSSDNGVATLRTPVSGRGHAVSELASIAPGFRPPGEHRAIEVVTRRLDDLGVADCGFIKIDVEAHEEAVLDGGWGLISRCRPVLMIELDERHNPGTIGRVSDRLVRASYDGYFLSRGELWPLTEFDPSRLQNAEAYMALPERQRRKAEYINNFIFFPREAELPRIARRAAR